MEKKRDSFFLKRKKENGKPERKDKDEIVNRKNKRQEELDKNRKGLDIKEKKPFDKKAYRLKKYSKKYKLEQWEEQRKKRLIREYRKNVKNDPTVGSYKPKSFDEETDGADETGKYVRHPDLVDKVDTENKTNEVTITKIKKDPFHKAKEHLKKVKQEKLEKQQQIEKIKEEKRQKMEEYKKKKQERFKKLSKKTKKGQPMMTGRLELLLEKIQSTK
ncbi:thyroid transcription factor 1-associated protein 26 homolog [Trichoplusia ni]|uniref:Thyroid transcription factor 1-associated protein 26 homolog n=1 Tax=Trichoplusia ni TaxID=7111 RepID=A0A7E5VJK2_TRINI|nr:thyroid transcription factor 1-associated protein 26 homolog [Trichoplusia ni]